ncbi:MAG TPA: hypothetical protein VGF00_01335, partial [Acidimicrobiia bacterium]
MAALADWVADLQLTVRRARHRRHLILAAGSAGALMLTTVGVALATDRVQPDIPGLGLPASPPPPAGDVPWTAATPSGRPVSRVTPATAPGGLTVWANSAGDTVRAGQPLDVSVSWRDEDGRLHDISQDWGDGSWNSQPRKEGCTGPTGGTSTFRHQWRTAGTYTIRFAVTTATCDGRTERRLVSFPVHVLTAVPRPIPTPGATTPLPSPLPTTPAPTPTPTTPPPTPTTSPTGGPTPTGTPSQTTSPPGTPTATATSTESASGTPAASTSTSVAPATTPPT